MFAFGSKGPERVHIRPPWQHHIIHYIKERNLLNFSLWQDSNVAVKENLSQPQHLNFWLFTWLYKKEMQKEEEEKEETNQHMQQTNK